MGRQSLSAYVIDTHVLIWMIEGHSRLGKQAQASIEAAAKSDNLYVSAITPWEIALLAKKGRIEIEEDILGYIEEALTEIGAQLCALTPSVSVSSVMLDNLHSDPADRIIVATALDLNATLITADKALLGYAENGRLKALGAEL